MHIVFVEEPRIIDGGMDWITFTTTEGAATNNALTAARAIIYDHFGADVAVNDWQGMGYKGFQFGPVRYGERNGNESITIISGPYSSLLMGKGILDAGRVTRLDTQVTVLLGEPQPEIASMAYRSLTRANQHSAKPRYVKLIKSNDGDTCYLGRRTGGVMLRLYDKSKDCGDDRPGAIWRLEVEYKKGASRTAYNRLEGEKDLLGICVGLTLAEFSKRGLVPNVNPENQISAIQVGAKIKTPEGQLDWLCKCVAPVVSQLVLAGYEREVFYALNLRGVAHLSGGK